MIRTARPLLKISGDFVSEEHTDMLSGYIWKLKKRMTIRGNNEALMCFINSDCWLVSENQRDNNC